MAPLLEKFRRDIAGILWFACALFLALALFSYKASDPSLNSVSSGASAKAVANLCGYFGSFLSDLLYQMLGLAAWVLVAATFRVSLRAFKGKPVSFQTWRVLCAALMILIFSSLL